jgi:uncharacterized membrane protein YqjE
VTDASETPSFSAAAGNGPVSGLFKSIANLFATVIAIALTRLELLPSDLQEEMHHVAGILVWTLIALLAALIGLFLGALAIIFVFWDTHRLLAAVAVTSAFFVIAAGAGVVLRIKIRTKPRMLDATLAELAKDREHLAGRR